MDNFFMHKGRLGHAPKVLITEPVESQTEAQDQQAKLVAISLAVNHRKKNQETGTYEDHTKWFDILLNGKEARYAAKHWSKGDFVEVTGFHSLETIETKEGYKKEVPKLIGQKVQLLQANNKNRADQDAQGQDVFTIDA